MAMQYWTYTSVEAEGGGDSEVTGTSGGGVGTSLVVHGVDSGGTSEVDSGGTSLVDEGGGGGLIHESMHVRRWKD